MKYERKKLAPCAMAWTFLLDLGSETVQAIPSNALARIDLGNPTSKAAHNFEPNSIPETLAAIAANILLASQ